MNKESRVRQTDELGKNIQSRIIKKEMEEVKIEMMLCINKRLFQQGIIPEEMYRLAKEEILRA